MKSHVVRLKSGGYWEAGVPYPEGDYDPETATDIDNLLNKPLEEILDPDSAIGRDTAARASEGDADIFK